MEEINGFPIYTFENDKEETESRAKLTPGHITSTLKKLTDGAHGDAQAGILLIACYMLLGVIIYKKDLTQVSKYVKHILDQGDEDYANMYRQLAEGIKEYKNDGVAKWEPRELGLNEVMLLGRTNARHCAYSPSLCL